MEEGLRTVALKAAIDLHKVWLKEGHISCSAELQLEDIQRIADKFYQFLEGDNK
jgi:hypothetical protein